ncbi:unnamed protein product [Schistosoma mattheei]|uniref:Uncharacterized protein n=1 Tax=Schistosoma mattheei TaxID=31246 RepID=A0A3P8HZF2_9TREM|nr:unnamed protein product [Schistosoma mattheei]
MATLNEPYVTSFTAVTSSSESPSSESSSVVSFEDELEFRTVFTLAIDRIVFFDSCVVCPGGPILTSNFSIHPRVRNAFLIRL